MNSPSVFALDSLSKRVVHISDVSEGYTGCICPHCKEPVISANRNLQTRVRSSYFRHEGTGSCGNETALHLFAKQLIQEEGRVQIPDYVITVSIPKRTKDKHSYTRLLEIDGDTRPLTNITLETNYPNSGRTADVVGDDSEGTLFIEIRVHHEVDIPKQQELSELPIDVIEIDLRELVDAPHLELQAVKNTILCNAPRQWITSQRYDKQCDLIRHQLEKERKNTIQFEQAKNSKRKRQREERRAEHQPSIDLITAYKQKDNRVQALSVYDRKLNTAGTKENKMLSAIIGSFHSIPSFINVPVKDELAFNCHRIYWQSLVLKCLRGLSHDPSSWVEITPAQVYEAIDGSYLLNTIAKNFELIEGEPLTGKRTNHYLKGVLTEREFDLIPKPVLAIRQYMHTLVANEILGKMSGDNFSPESSVQMWDCLNRLFK